MEFIWAAAHRRCSLSRRNKMSCVLRIVGKDLRINDLLDIKLETDSFWSKGEPRFSTNPEGEKRKDSGATYLVSDAEFEDFDVQIKEAIEYLNKNKNQIKSIMSLSGIDGSSLDFGIVWRDVAVQCDYFPPELIQIAGELGLGIELSQYPPSDED